MVSKGVSRGMFWSVKVSTCRMCKINPIQTIQKPSSIRKIKAQCPETESGFCFTFKLLQPWEEKMGLLMLLLVVMAASSHLMLKKKTKHKKALKSNLLFAGDY